MNLAQLKKMAGVGPSMYESWRQTPENGRALSESRESESPSGKSQVRRIARMLEDDRIGGRHPLRVLAEAASAEAAKKSADAGKYSDKASAAASHAHGLGKQAHKGGFHDPAHAAKAHAAAAEAHRKAARLHGAMGDDRTAHGHDKEAAKHDHHAKMHQKHASSRVLGVEKDPFKDEPKKAKEPEKKAKAAPKEKAKEKGKKKGFLGRLKDKIVAKVKGAGGIDWEKKSKEIGKKEKSAQRKDQEAGERKVARSYAMDRLKKKRPEFAASRAAKAAEKDSSKSSEDKAKARKTASHEYLQKALHHFHSGKHDQAVRHLNIAIKHARKSGYHQSGHEAQQKQARRAAERPEPGPRAQVGRTSVPRR